MKRVLLVVLLLVGCGGGGSDTPSSLVAEQSDWFDGVEYHRFYRYSGHRVGYASSLDGVSFSPVAELMVGDYPVLVWDGGPYLVVRQGDSYNVYDVSVPSSPVFVQEVLRGDYCNMAVVVVDGVWHAIVEGHDGDYFYLVYMRDFRDPVFLRGDAGNPTMHLVGDVVFVMYGADYRSTGLWMVRAAAFDFERFTEYPFVLSGPTHVADPDLGVGEESGLLTVGWGQDSIRTYRYVGTRDDLYRAVVAGHVELEDLGVTMRQ